MSERSGTRQRVPEEVGFLDVADVERGPLFREFHDFHERESLCQEWGNVLLSGAGTDAREYAEHSPGDGVADRGIEEESLGLKERLQGPDGGRRIDVLKQSPCDDKVERFVHPLCRSIDIVDCNADVVPRTRLADPPFELRCHRGIEVDRMDPRLRKTLEQRHCVGPRAAARIENAPGLCRVERQTRDEELRLTSMSVHD